MALLSELVACRGADCLRRDLVLSAPGVLRGPCHVAGTVA